jgi:hypothetical protein
MQLANFSVSKNLDLHDIRSIIIRYNIRKQKNLPSLQFQFSAEPAIRAMHLQPGDMHVANFL